MPAPNVQALIDAAFEEALNAELAADAVVDVQELQAALAADAVADAEVLAAKDGMIATLNDAIQGLTVQKTALLAEIASLNADVIERDEEIARLDAEIIALEAQLAEADGNEGNEGDENDENDEGDENDENDEGDEGDENDENDEGDEGDEGGTTPPLAWPSSANTGYKKAPGYPGSLTAGPASLTAGATYSFRLFNGTPTIPANVTFIGCRFTSNWSDGWNVRSDNNVTFKFCTFEPQTPAAPPNAAWPSAGAGLSVAGDSAQIPYMIASGYQYGIHKPNGTLLMEDCDMWGFGNAVTMFGTAQKTIRRCWIHDAARAMTSGELYHHDGPGHLDGGGCSNVLIEDCTIASLGNTNGLAFQIGSYSNIVIRRNYLSGWGFTADLGHGGGNDTGMIFEDNVIATDIQSVWGPLYTNFVTTYRSAGSSWKRNKLRVMPGTVKASGAVFSFTQADDGKFIHPDGAKSTTDWAG
jgi:hypothetical protein